VFFFLKNLPPSVFREYADSPEQPKCVLFPKNKERCKARKCRWGSRRIKCVDTANLQTKKGASGFQLCFPHRYELIRHGNKYIMRRKSLIFNHTPSILLFHYLPC